MLWTWGHGGNGRLGHGNTNDLRSPKMIDNCEYRFTKIAAGDHHTLAITGPRTLSFSLFTHSFFCLGSKLSHTHPLPLSFTLIKCKIHKILSQFSSDRRQSRSVVKRRTNEKVSKVCFSLTFTNKYILSLFRSLSHCHSFHKKLF
jgi:alpha-tubulin suppressor-like RCC1 family protein